MPEGETVLEQIHSITEEVCQKYDSGPEDEDEAEPEIPLLKAA